MEADQFITFQFITKMIKREKGNHHMFIFIQFTNNPHHHGFGTTPAQVKDKMDDLPFHNVYITTLFTFFQQPQPYVNR